MSNFRYVRPAGFPPVVKNLIIINVLVWIAQLIFDRQTVEFDGYEVFSMSLTNKIALHSINDPEFKPYQIATHMFAHSSYVGLSISFFHILINMFVLYMFGRTLENVWGSKRFLFFYLACGVGAAVAHLAMQYFMDDYARAVGASGAVMGVFIAFAYLFPNTELMLIPIPIPIKAKWLAAAYVAYDLFGGMGQLGESNIAHFAHLGGALTGFIIVYIWNKTNRRTLY